MRAKKVISAGGQKSAVAIRASVFRLLSSVLCLATSVQGEPAVYEAAEIFPVVRLLAGALGDDDSARDESFTNGLLEYPHYTRPEVFRGMKVPEILLSGDHARIAEWRRRQALERTEKWRPDLLGADDPGLADK